MAMLMFVWRSEAVAFSCAARGARRHGWQALRVAGREHNQYRAGAGATLPRRTAPAAVGR
eukprot:6213255-Pleurochrysis_carterae.AAC.6